MLGSPLTIMSAGFLTHRFPAAFHLEKKGHREGASLSPRLETGAMAIHTYSSFKGERKNLNRIFAADLQFGNPLPECRVIPRKG